jgi:hypothetical protein
MLDYTHHATEPRSLADITRMATQLTLLRFQSFDAAGIAFNKTALPRPTSLDPNIVSKATHTF